MRRHIILLLIGSCTAFTGRADSPLTSIAFAQFYTDIPEVKQVLDEKVRDMSTVQFRFLDDTTIHLDQKIALINAMGWGDSARFERYAQHLATKYKIKRALLDSILTWRGPQPTPFPGTEMISAHDLSCFAYHKAMCDYFHPVTAYYAAYMGVDKNGNSEAASYVYGLILAQIYLDLDWCRVYEVMSGIRQFDAFQNDRWREGVVDDIFKYIDMYKESCKRSEMDPKKQQTENRPEDQIVYYKKPESRQLMLSKKKYADLAIHEIMEPEWDGEQKATIIRVQILNKGNQTSVETNAKVYDVDLTYEQAKKLGIKGDALSAIKENNERAVPGDYPPESLEHIQEGIDYDAYFESFQRIPPVKPGEIVTITFTVKYRWVYDSNCEIEVIIDLDDNIEEKDEKNNRQFFIAWG